MFIEFLNFYFIFVLVVSISASLVLLRGKIAFQKLFLGIMIAIIVLPALFGYVYLTYFTVIKEVVVPELAGMPLDKAQDFLGEVGLRGEDKGSVYSMKYAVGEVVAQQPEAGRIVKVGRLINLTTSSGKRLVFVPNLLGRGAEQATSVLVAKDLVLGQVDYEPAPGTEIGVIISQDPLPEEEVEVGTMVNLVVVTREAKVQKKKEDEEAEDKGGFWFW
ncbi:MAG: PASTA domain-containing protein [bacterium]|nr:PASTA domain-containing protein [Candidatus Margulisiibacteriota bacterium]